MNTKKILAILITISCTLTVFAQKELDLNKAFGFKDYCFDKNIHTILAFKTGNELSEPFIELNKGESVTFMFDDLSETTRDFYYTITHCSADWEEENIFVGDYMRGMNENNLFQFQTSSNTHIDYRNYEFTIPNEDVDIIISGNYMLKVFDRHTNSLIFQKGFRVVEPKASVNIKHRWLTNYSNDGKQQLELSVNKGNLTIQNPYNELKLRVEQNSQIVPGTPNPTISFQNNMLIDYTNATKNIYYGENEFKTFDTRNLSYNALGVNKITKQNQEFHVLLNIDAPTDKLNYEYNRDINGKYYIEADRIDKNANKNITADYIHVYFTLDAPFPETYKEIYIYGSLSNWGLSPLCKMEYSETRQAYEATILLKQGYYNYKYVAVDNNMNFSSNFADNNFSQTENEYIVYVYYRGQQDRCDKLVAVGGINSAGKEK